MMQKAVGGLKLSVNAAYVPKVAANTSLGVSHIEYVEYASDINFLWYHFISSSLLATNLS